MNLKNGGSFQRQPTTQEDNEESFTGEAGEELQCSFGSVHVILGSSKTRPKKEKEKVCGPKRQKIISLDDVHLFISRIIRTFYQRNLIDIVVGVSWCGAELEDVLSQKKKNNKF